MATFKANDLWQDIHITPGMDSICTSYKIMIIPVASRGKQRNTQSIYLLEEIQVETVPNLEPLRL